MLSIAGNETPFASIRGQIHNIICTVKTICNSRMNTTAFRWIDHFQLLSTALWSIYFSIFIQLFQVHKGLAHCVDTELLRQQLDAVKHFQRLMVWLGFHPTSANHSPKSHQRYLSGKRYLYRHWYDFCEETAVKCHHKHHWVIVGINKGYLQFTKMFC